MRLLDRGVGLISTLILARLLLPADFGLVAMAITVTGLLETLTQFGFESALIRKATVEKKDYDTAWTLYVILGLALGIAIAVAASPAAAFYHTPDVAPILYVLAIAPVLSGFENIGIVDFRRRLEFHWDFTFQASKRLAGALVTIPLAFYWHSYWALIAGMLTSRLVGLGLSHAMSPHRMSLSLATAREILGFSMWLLLHNLLFFLRVRSASLFLGRFHGPTSVGGFTMAADIASLPNTELVMPLDRALLPSYSTLTQQADRLQSAFIRVLALIALVSIPASAGLAAVADLAVPILLGPQWTEIVPAMKILALFGVTIALQMNCGAILVALGKPRLQAGISLIQVMTMFALLLLLVPSKGMTGAAIAYLIAGLISLPISYAVTLANLRCSADRLLAAVWRPLLGSAVMYVALQGPFFPFASSPGNLMEATALLAAKIALGALVYMTVIAVAWMVAGRPEGAERDLVRLVLRRL
jgi:O-antigen/teichoic acid export membrane protein